jgi:hypothetical protein
LDGVIRAAQSSAYMVRVYRRVILCLVPPCALGTGNLALIRTAAAELPQINLDDALRICLVIREREPASFDRGPRAAGWRATRRSEERPWHDWRWQWRRSTSCARSQIWPTKYWNAYDPVR